MVLNHVIGSAVAVVIMCTALYLLGYATGPAYSASDKEAQEPVLDGDDVIHHDHSNDVPLVNPVRIYHRGTKIDGGCEFTDSLDPIPGHTMVMSRMVSVNWETCEWIDEVGGVAPEHQDGLMDDSPGSDGSMTLPDGAQASSSTKVAKYKTGWVDPLGIYVNYLQTGIEYRYGAVNIYRVGHSCKYVYLTLTGWSTSGGTCTTPTTTPKKIDVRQSRKFSNSSFPCNGGTGAKVNYSYNTVGATVSGGPFKYHSTRATGDCAHLLGKRSTLYTNDNR